MSRPILLGEAPSARGDQYHAFPLSGPPARVLCQLAGIPPIADGSTYGRWTWALYDRFECRNLFERYSDATPWRVRAARERVAEIRPELVGRVVVLLGRNVQAAVWTVLAAGAPEPPPDYCEWTFPWDVPSAPRGLVTIPHPSGLNRMLNEAEERERVGGTLREALARAGGVVPDAG